MWITGRRGSEAIPGGGKKQTAPTSLERESAGAEASTDTSVVLTYLPVSANFTILCRNCRRHWLVRSDRTWSSHGKAHLPPAQHAACEDARFPCADGDEMGPRDAGAPPQEGTQAAHRPDPGQIRGSLGRPRRHSAFRGMHGSRGVRSCSASRERGSAFELDISMSGSSLPLSRIHQARRCAWG